jgi:group I intron endonuclease
MAGSSLGMKLTDITREKMSEAKLGVKNHFFGKSHSEETRQKMSTAKGGSIIYLYSITNAACLAQDGMNLQLLKTFISSRAAGKYLNCSGITVMKYARSGQVFQNKYILSLKEL